MGGISGIEGGIRKNGLTYRVSRPPSVASMRSETGIEVLDTHNNGFLDGNSGFPPESMADSKSDGMVVSEVDEDEDEDFVMEQTKSEASEEEIEAMLPSRVPKVTYLSRCTFPHLHIFSRLLAEHFVLKFKVYAKKPLLLVQ